MACSSKRLPEPVEEPRQRRIRSYVRREGRMTDAQKVALRDLWPCYGIDIERSCPQILDLTQVFGRQGPCHMEIGMGMGDVIFDMAIANPHEDFLGVDVYRPGMGKLMARLDAHKVSNVRLLCADAVTILDQVIPASSLDHIYLLFPDPWPKKRHHKRRLLQTEFAARISNRLKPEGHFHLATDWKDYAMHMIKVMEEIPAFINTSGPGIFAPRPDQRSSSRFERRGIRMGHGIWELDYRKAKTNEAR